MLRQTEKHVRELIAAYPVLSIRQPWAWAILYAGKDVENRAWRYSPNYRGPLLVHAGKQWYDGSFDDDDRRLFQGTVNGAGSIAVVPADMPRGGIVGLVDLVDVVWESNSPWFFGPMAFALQNPRPLPFTPCKGALGMFKAKFPEGE